ncbi:hypothetical protein BDK51DRAFT_27805, partial [Blyttiomyces helicus]
MSGCPVAQDVPEREAGAPADVEGGEVNTAKRLAEMAKQVREEKEQETAQFFDSLWGECQKIEDVSKKAEIEVLRRRDNAFYANSDSLEAIEIKRTEEQIESSVKERASRGNVNHTLSTLTRDLGAMHLQIQNLQSAEMLTAELNASTNSHRTAFNSRVEHLEAAHVNEMSSLIEAQEREAADRRKLVQMSSSLMSDVAREQALKELESELSRKKMVDKRQIDNLKEVQQMELKHLKEVFQIEIQGIEDRYEQLLTNRTETYEIEQQHEVEAREAQAKLVQMKEEQELKQMKVAGRQELRRLHQLHRMQVQAMEKTQKVARKAREKAWDTRLNLCDFTAEAVRRANEVAENEGDAGDEECSETDSSCGSESLSAPSHSKSVDGDELSSAAIDRGDDVGEEPGSNVQAEIRHLENRQREEISAQLRSHRAAIAATEAATMRNITQAGKRQTKERKALVRKHAEEVEVVARSHRREAEAQASVRNAEARIMLEQRVMSRLLDSVVDGVISITPNGNIVKFNTAAERMFKYSAKEALGKNVNILMPEHIAVQHDSYLNRYMDSGVSKLIGVTSRQVGRRKNGEIFPMELSLSEVKEAEYHAFVAIL